MSNSPLEAFALEIGRNPDLQKKIEAIRFDASSDVIAQLVALSAEAGTPVSAEEWSATFVHVDKEQLSDDELKNVAGGGLFEWLTRFPVQDRRGG